MLPDNQPITYSWNFGDGSPVSTQANPAHTFTAPVGVPTEYVVTLTVRDSGNLSAQATLIVSVNNTPPNVTITSPVNGTLYSPVNPTTVNLTATVSDAESSDSQLLYQWQVLLHHNDHNHGSPVDTNHATTAVIEPTGCDGINIYYYRILLTVTDPQGLATTREVRLYPDCGPDTPPTISNIPDQTIFQNSSTGPIPFTVGDAQVAAANLQLSAASSNPGLVPNGNIVFGGSGANRTVTVTPAAGQTGTATITVTVNDGPNNTSTNFVVTVNPGSPTPTPTPTPPAGLVAAYNFNQGSGTTVTDASGNGITGNIIGATWTTGGRNGNALSFNGSSSYVDLGNPALLQITGSMTWSAWVKAAANPPDDGQIVAKSNDASGWQFKTSPDTGPHTFGVGVAGATNTFAQRYSTTVRSLNVWYHVAGVYNASARTLDIYVNGVLNNGTLSGTVPASQINSAVNVNIGRRSGGLLF